MKNILINKEKSDIINRIKNLSAQSQPLWGKMTVNQMICHVADQIRMAIGEIKTRYIGNFALQTFAKPLVLLGMPTPKAKVETTKELHQEKEGTQPVGFEADRNKLIALIENFDQSYTTDMKVVHPAFGAMSKNQWARLVYLHLNHHLTQFGI